MSIDKIKVNLQYFLPKHLLTRAAGILAGAKLGKATTFAISQFAKFYNVDLREMQGNVSDYKTFNDFFSRPLKHGARTINETIDSVIFPSDGKISQFGNLQENFQLQAKGHYFTCEALLGSDEDAKSFKNGHFATVYLSPRDYHRVHMPYSGKLIKMTYIPGELFSVNPLYTQNIPELFSRNERVVCIFETAIGKMAVVLVGAAIVRSIITSWDGVVAPNGSKDIFIKEYADENIFYEKGEEIARFAMGSTVICLFEKNKIEFAKNIAVEKAVKVGEKMGQGNSKVELNSKSTVKKTTATKKKVTRTTAKNSKAKKVTKE